MESLRPSLFCTSLATKRDCAPVLTYHVPFRRIVVHNRDRRGSSRHIRTSHAANPPQLKILDPLFRVGTSRPQRMHNGIALSLLDFLLMAAMLLLTPNDEWMNMTRPSQ
jgi:hypothetical protein